MSGVSVSVASRNVWCKCISCVPSCQPQKWRVACPAVSNELYQLRPNIRLYKSPTIARFLHSFTVLYLIHSYTHTHTHTHTKLLNDIHIAQCCYIIFLSNVSALLKNSFRRWQAHNILNIAHFKLLLWFDEHAFSGKSFKALSLAVQEYKTLDSWTVLIKFLSILEKRLCDVLLTYCCFISRSYSFVSPNMFDN